MEIKNYEDYVKAIHEDIDRVMTLLYQYQKDDDTSSGISECKELASLVMTLGVVSDILRPVLKNNIPIQATILDEWFQKIEIEKLDNLFLIGLLRFTNVAKNQMTQWFILRDKIAALLEQRGENPKVKLRGLF